MSNSLGNLFERLRTQWKAWRIVFFVILAVLVGLNFALHPHHPHFDFEYYPGSWGAFGLLVGLAMVVIMKKIVQPFIARGEDYYDRD